MTPQPSEANSSLPHADNDALATQTIARSGVWLMLDNTVAIVAGLISSIVVARALGPEKLGYYNYVVWASAMVKLVADLGVPLAVRRYLSEYRGRGDLVTVSTIVVVARQFQRAVSVTVVLVSLGVVFTLVPHEHRWYAALLMASVGPSLLVGFSASVLWATGNLEYSVRVSLATCVLNLAMTLGALALGWELVGLATAAFVSRSVDFALRRHFTRKVIASFPPALPKLDPDLRARMVRFCWHQTVLLAIEVVIWNRFELFFLEKLSDIRQVAFYSLTFNLVQYFLLLPQVMSASAGATMMVRQGQAPETVGPMAATSLWFIFMFAVPATFGVAALSAPMMALLYGEAYLEAIPVLTLLALFGLARALSYPVLEVLYVTEKQLFVVRWSLLMVAVNVALGVWWIPTSGAIGAALVKGTVQILSIAGLWTYAARSVRLKLPLGRVGKLLFSATVMALVVAAFASVVPPVVAVIVGIPLGVLVLAAMLRLSRCLDLADRGRLTAMQKVLPAPARRAYLALLDAVVSPSAR